MKNLLSGLALAVVFMNSSLTMAQDIIGIKIGSSPSEVKKILGCSDYSPLAYEDEFFGPAVTACDINSGEYDVSYDHLDKAYEVTRLIRYFKDQPNIVKIKKQLIEKFGKPSAEGISRNKYAHSTYEFCWGGCRKTDNNNNSYWDGTSVFPSKTSQSFLVTYSHYPSKDLSDQQGLLKFVLFDPKRENNAKKWAQNEYNLDRKQAKNKLSELDL